MRRKLLERKTPPEWNVRVMTEDDFWTHCDAAQIVVREAPLEQLGYSIVCDGRPHIFIHDELRGAARLFTLYHELAHHWLHPRQIQFFRVAGSEDVEIEANIVAKVALVPQTLLTHYAPSEIAELYGYPDWLIEKRQTVLEVWGI